MAESSYFNTVARGLTTSGISINTYTFSSKIDGLGVEINLTSTLPNGVPYPDSKGDIRTFRYLGVPYEAKLQSIIKAVSELGTVVTAFYVGVEATITKRAPKKEIRYMTLEPADLYEFLLKAMPQAHTIDYVPMIRTGSQFGNYGWTFYSILDRFKYYLGVSDIITNIPDFYVKSMEISGSFYDALRDFFADLKPRVFLKNNRLFIINYNYGRSDVWTNTLTIKSVHSVNINSTDVERPKYITVSGGEVPFDKALYKGPRSYTDQLIAYPILLQNPRVPDVSGNLTQQRLLNCANVFGIAYSYGTPFTFVSVEDSFELLSFDDLPDIQKNAVNALLGGRSSPDEYLFTATLRRIKEEIYVRDFFNEQGPKVYEATYEFYKDFSARKETFEAIELGNESEPQPDPPDPPAEGNIPEGDKARRVVYKVAFPIGTGTLRQFSETFYNYNYTMDVRFKSPVLSSTFLVVDPETNIYTPIITGFPSEMTTNFAYMPTEAYNASGSVSKFMPSEIKLKYLRHSPNNTPRFIRGDLMEEIEVSYGLCYALNSAPSKRFKITENELQFKFNEGNYFPIQLSDFDPTVDYKCAARFLLTEVCITEIRRTSFTRAGFNQVRKDTKVSTLQDSLGVPTTSYFSEISAGELPNSRHQWRGMDYEATNDSTPPEQEILDEAKYEVSFKNLCNIPDIHMALELVKKYLFSSPDTVTLQFKSEFPIDVGWLLKFKDDRVSISDPDNSLYGVSGTAHQFPENTRFLVTQVQSVKSPEDITLTISAERI